LSASQQPGSGEPRLELHGAALRRNVEAWRSRAGAGLRAVVKADGYGWGLGRVIAAVDPAVDGYLVADVAEFERARTHTDKPVATLADVSASDVGPLLDRGGIPSLADPAAFGAAGGWAFAHGRRPRVRLGVRNAASWGGVDPAAVPALARSIATLPLDVEVWTHLTDPTLARAQRETFSAAVAALRRSGVAVVATDVASTVPLAEGADGAGVRLGIGMFGFRCGAPLEAVASALRVRAEIVRVVPACGQLMSYGTALAPERGWLVVVRCGYADGLPRVADPRLGILTVGMQYAVAHRDAPPGDRFVDLIGETTDLDLLAEAAHSGAHEIVVRLGHAAAAARLRATEARA
jgi:alanine racemase